jgi:hypothetical protein
MIAGLQLQKPYTCYKVKWKANPHEFQTKNRALLPLVYNCTERVVTSRREPTNNKKQTLWL